MCTSYQKTGAKSDLNNYDNPTRKVLEETLAALDNAKYCCTFPSGTGGQMTLMSGMKSGDGIICGDNIYTGTIGLFREIGAELGLTLTFIDLTNLNNLKNALRPNTKMVWMETPTNPMMIVLDIKAIADMIHRDAPQAFLAVDNTASTAYLQRPLDLGADMACYSLTKFMNGHNDVVMGSIATNNQQLYEKMRYTQNITGIIPSPFDCYLVCRSMKTLALRMERHSENALAIARFLENHPRVGKVLHPGLTSHPQHDIAIKQSYGHSGSFCFYIKDGELEMTRSFLKSLNVFMHADSLGGCESLAQAPLLWFHNITTSFTDEEVQLLGLTPNLIRLSVGLEDKELLIDDVDRALNSW